MATTFIYALRDPRDGRVRYVGKTENIERRISCHLASRDRSPRGRWMADLHKSRLRPLAVVLQEVDVERWQDAERRWIRRLSRRVRLLNGINGGGGAGDRSKAGARQPKPEDVERIVAWFSTEDGARFLQRELAMRRLFGFDRTKRGTLGMNITRTVHRVFGRFGAVDKALMALVIGRVKALSIMTESA